MKALSRIAAAVLVLAHGCTASRAKLNHNAGTFERAGFDSCMVLDTLQPMSPGRRALYCACAAGVSLQRVPAALIGKATFTAEETEELHAIGRAAGTACMPVSTGSAAECEAALTAVPPGQPRVEACDCVLGGFVEEFAPVELARFASGQGPDVMNAKARVDATYQRCMPQFAAAAASDSPTDWSLILSIGSALLSAGALAVSAASGTSAPDTRYLVLPPAQ